MSTQKANINVLDPFQKELLVDLSLGRDKSRIMDDKSRVERMGTLVKKKIQTQRHWETKRTKNRFFQDLMSEKDNLKVYITASEHNDSFQSQKTIQNWDILKR